MRLIYLCLFSLTTSFSLFSQTGSIKGTLKDSKTQEPIIGATIVVEGTALGAASDVEGQFTIHKVPAGNQSILISYIGYAKKKIENITVEEGNSSVINTAMEEESTLLVEGVTFQVTRL